MNCVFTINIPAVEERRKFYDLCTETSRRYAGRVGADFHCLQVRYHPDQTPHAEKIFCGDLLRIYDRILFVDADILIKRDAPNIFDLQTGFIHLLSETDNIPVDSQCHHGTIIDRFGPMKCPMTSDGRYHYYNTGVMLFDKSQGRIFQYWDWGRYFSDIYEQTYLNGLIVKYGNPKLLDRKFNMMMTFHADKKNQAYFIHYTDADKTGSTAFADWERWCK